MVAVRYLVPYQVDIKGKEISTNKPIENTLYYRCGAQAVSPPAYGAPVPGSSSTQTLLTNIISLWEAQMVPLLSENYGLSEYVLRAIVGKQYTSPLLSISGASIGTPVTISTSGPHNLASGEMVSITGVSSPAGLNANWQVTVVNTTSFSLDGSSFTGTWSGNGQVQKVTGRLTLSYEDMLINGSTAEGDVSGGALPAYCSVSIRRLAQHPGRNFRSRIGFGIIGEDSQTNGVLTGAYISSLTTALTNLNAGLSNGGSDASSGLSAQQALSRKLALGQISPFSSSVPFCSQIQNYGFRTRLGSQVSRKGRIAIG